MSHRSRALVVALVSLALATGCVSVIADQRTSQAPPPVVPPPGVPAPIAGHPPVTASGVVRNFDAPTGILTLGDGRIVKLTGESKVVRPIGEAVRAGDPVVLQDVLPVGVHSGVKTLAVGKPQRMATVASVDEPNGLVRLTDGTLVRVSGTTHLHLGAAGSSVALTELAPGDELVIVEADAAASSSSQPGDAVSALARQDDTPRLIEAAELMIFRVPRKW
jgi:hypothetical protein